MKETFEKLITDFCYAAGLANPAAIMDGALFETGDVAFSLRYDEHAPEAMLIYTDFGPMPAKKKKPIYSMLLEENFLNAIGSNGTHGMSAATKNIVYIEQVSVAEMTQEKLCKKFALLSEQAKEWRATHYLGGQPASAARPRNASRPIR